MRMILTASALLLLISGNAQAGSGYDSCTKEEKALKTQEASECHGFRSLLNPSACYATQRKLKEYTTTDRCRKIGLAEKVDFSAPPVIPEKKATATTATGSADTVGKTGTVSPLAVIKAEPAVPQQESTCEQLKEENARLKTEVSRLTTELEQYTKACR